MTPELLAALRGVLAATPDPPPTSVDPSDVMAAAQSMTEVRAGAIAALESALVGAGVGAGVSRGAGAALRDECAPFLSEIGQREARWAAALERARHEMGVRLSAVRRRRRLSR